MTTRTVAAILAVLTAGALLCSCHTHKASNPATCTEASVCTECGEIIEPAKGHTVNGNATCTTASVCTVCGITVEPAKGHTYPENYSCTEAVKCTVCGTEIAAPGEHKIPQSVPCDEDTVCEVCHQVIKAAAGHIPLGEATCTKPSVCKNCEKVLAPAKGHTPGPAATATTPQVCTVCGTVLAPATSSKSETETNFVYIPETEKTGHYKESASSYNSAQTVLCCGNYLMEYFGAKSSGNEAYANMVSAFAKKFSNVRVNCVIVPKCASIYSPSDKKDQYQSHKEFIEATYGMMTGVITADAMGEIYSHKGEYMFYRTDHHWTSLGAYYASVAFCKANGITAKSLDSYEKVENTGFTGTLYTTYWGNPKPSGVMSDYTVGHIPLTNYVMKYTNTAGDTAANITGTAINKSAKSYASMFLGGDHPLTHIVTDNKNGKKLIVFKESYGNAFVPYMIDYFEEILVVDIRSSTASVAGLISSYGITDAVIINNIQAVSSLQSALKSRLES